MKRLGLGLAVLLAACRAATNSGDQSSAADTTAAPTTLGDLAYGATGVTSGTDNGLAPAFSFSPAGRAVVLHMQATSVSFRALLADGTPDLASGANGDVDAPLVDADFIPTGSTVEDDGTVIVYGQSRLKNPNNPNDPNNGELNPAIVRLVKGALDTGFAEASTGLLAFSDAPGRVDSVATTHDANGAVTGYYASLVFDTAPGVPDPANPTAKPAPIPATAKLVHLDLTGAVDTAFGGKTPVTFPVTTAATEHFPVTINSQGFATVVRTSTCTISRFTAAGTGDPTFGTAGVATTPAGIVGCNAFERPDGGMIVAVSSSDNFMIEPLTSAGAFGAALYTAPRAQLTVLADVAKDGSMFIDQQGNTLLDFNLERLKADGTVDASYPPYPALLNGIRILANGEAMIGTYTTSLTNDVTNGSTFPWSVQRLFASPQPAAATADAGTDAGTRTTTADGGANKPGPTTALPTSPVPSAKPVPPSNTPAPYVDPDPDTGSEYSEPASAPATHAAAAPAAENGGCSSAPGGASTGAPWLVLALAALATRRRRRASV